MPPFLQKKLVGLPTWAWLAILAGGLTIGLILRSRQKAADEESGLEDLPVEEELPVDQYDQYGDLEGMVPTSFDEGLSGGGLEGLGGGYVNYPIQPIQPGITVTGPGSVTVTPPASGGGGGGGGGGGDGCGKKPKKPKCEGKDKKWECKNGQWKCKTKGGGGGGGGGGGHNRPRARAATGGGPPVRRDNHRRPQGKKKNRNRN